MSRKTEIATVAGIACASLLPFVAKAFSLDDPLFLWAAQNAREHPLDPYGVAVNWVGTWQPCWEIAQNPPLTSYYMAAAGTLFGFSEIALHLAFILPAALAVVGTWKLASEITPNRVVAALAALSTPAFLASSTSLMCDTLMVCFYTWAVALWMDGVKGSSGTKLAFASVLVAAACLTKYFALSLFPLLAVATVAIAPRRAAGLLWLLIPVALFSGFQFWTWKMHGVAHVLSASAFAGVDRGVPLLAKTAIGLSFLGGSFLPVALFAPFVFSKRLLAFAVGVVVATAVYMHDVASISERGALNLHRTVRWEFAIHFGLFIGAGVLVLALAFPKIRDVRREPVLLVLSLWILGTFVFAAFLNWGANVRSMLPMAPAAAVLIAHRLGPRIDAAKWALIPALAVSLVVAQADCAWANSWRNLADSVSAATDVKTLWFEGHWGWQWYLQSRGAKAADLINPQWPIGSKFAVPRENANTQTPPSDCIAANPEPLETPVRSWAVVMSRQEGVGFGSSFFGPLPFMFATPEPTRCDLCVAVKPGKDWPVDGESTEALGERR